MEHTLRGKNKPHVDASLIQKDERGDTFAPTVQFCSHCGQSMSDPCSFIVEYWRSEQTIYFCWCRSCGTVWELAEIKQFTTMELEEDD
jgi:DNA-directed RNA polymerase subunit M/transcription elongation factor TFIIS